MTEVQKLAKIKVLKDILKEYELLAKYNGGIDYDRWKALEMAIKALEQLQDVHDTCKNCIEFSEFKQQPSEDCIRRQAVIILIDEASEIHPYKVVGDSDTYSNYNQGWSDACDWLYANIEGVPSVTPQYTDEEIDKIQAVEQAYVDKMVELAVEETKRPKGKWIKIEYDVCTFIYKCTKCGMRVINPYKYCPNCGAEMEVEDEVSD